MGEYLQNVNPEETGIEMNGKYTMFYIDSAMALTHRVEIEVAGIKKVDSYAQYNNLLQVIFREKGKRKLGGVYLGPDMLFLEGWDLGIKADTDYGSFWGNACINLVGNPQELREKIDTLNRYKLADKGVITYAEPVKDEAISGGFRTDNIKLLYPEEAEKIRDSHGPVDEMLKKEKGR